ncbi:hypothetical protein ETAA8_34040 [Anatilimnocola aggregata]|uniref:Uncharacterized protein n=1 Tax=Anatilimnocola aggregata TaxID=2528021 RepID=A0A517YDK0_9BACT|nr:hypothetical protein [Anatilimnocola aggregata]QDU28304.1 hypothetical protein ETAA8_34040 [Anatilimnocola aggregata]
MMVRKVNYIALGAVALLVSVPYLISGAADDAKAPAATSAAAPAAPDLFDPAFERYVDLLLLGQAWETLDAVLLTDCALQLAEGERVLMRSHKAISSQQVLDLAAKIAADKRDTATLDRLANVAQVTKNTAASEQIAAARKLASASRSVNPALSVPAAATTPDQLALYQEAINGAKAATALGDATYFKNLEAGLADTNCILVSLSPTQRSYLKTLISETLPALPKQANPALSETLMKLKEVSRESRFNPFTSTGGFDHQGQMGGGAGGFGQQGGFGQPPQQGFGAGGGHGFQGQTGFTGNFGQGHNGYYQQRYPQQYPRPYQNIYQYQFQYGQQGYPRPPCYSPSLYGQGGQSHGWCGNR